jgi:hypothetical protein
VNYLLVASIIYSGCRQCRHREYCLGAVFLEDLERKAIREDVLYLAIDLDTNLLSESAIDALGGRYIDDYPIAVVMGNFGVDGGVA